MKVSEIGEFGLIDVLTKMIADAQGESLAPDLILGIGDDAAAWKCSDTIQLATVDTMVQDVHFSLEMNTWKDLGWKSLAINLSDIAAMGGVPRYALVALSLPPETEVADVTALYQGMLELARQFRVHIIGGNISRSMEVSITITVIGNSVNHSILKRSAARPGDTIAVTGYPGSAAAGLEMLSKNLRFKPADAQYFKNAFLLPTPRIAEGQLLVKHCIAAAIDISDGLLADLRHICEASHVSARVITDFLPIHDMVKASFRKKTLSLALGGGEDYELLFTGAAAAIARVRAQCEIPVTVIGEIIAAHPGEIIITDETGQPVNPGRMGWDHFKR
jgi:thiamine-monophosphate kinase